MSDSVLPELIDAKRSTKKLILFALAREWPLSPKQIYTRLNQNQGIECTYQAVYKQVKEMEFLQILEKQERGYLINEKWLDKIVAFCCDIKDIYRKQRELTINLRVDEN